MGPLNPLIAEKHFFEVMESASLVHQKRITFPFKIYRKRAYLDGQAHANAG
jgi:hypothetical protein